MNEQIPQPDKIEPENIGQDTPAMPVAENKAKSADFFSRISITQLTLAVMVVVFLWQWLDERRIIDGMQQQLAIKIDEMESSSKATRQLLVQGQEQVSELSVKVATLESRYAELQNQRGMQENSNNELSASRDETALAEVEQMLLNAAQQLQLSANVRAALIFMQSADARLQHMNKPASRSLSKIIGRDMDKLRALPIVDITGINRQLNKLIAAVDELPLAYQQHAANEADAKSPQEGYGGASAGSAVTLAPSKEETAGQKLLREIWQEMKQLVQIENTGKDEIPLLHPEQQFFLRENLKLRLLSARIALLSRDEAVFRQELKNTQLWTARYFDAKSPAVLEVLSGMKQLAVSRISIELPDLGSSLQAVRNYRLTAEKTVR
ncbi:MAG: uroporphyrinogen-III C-methyltransferase [Pseudomonadota bacterium]